MDKNSKKTEFLKDLVKNEFYAQAQATWEVNDLIIDLDKIKKEHSVMGEGLTHFHQQYLLMVLVGKTLENMIDQLEDITSVASLRTKLSVDKRKKGIHFCLEKLLKQEISNAQDIVYHLFNSKYRKMPQPPKQDRETGLLIRIPDELSAEQLCEIENKVRAITGCPYIRIVEIKMGSMILIFKGSQSACEQIEALHKQGLLSARLGIAISDVEILPNQVSLTQWFENVFTTGWQMVTELLNPQQLQVTARSQRIERGKLIDLQADLLTNSVVLLINLSRENDDSSTVEITLRVYPTGDEVYLPPSLKLLVLSNNEVFEEVTARSADVFMRCQFEGELGEDFTVQLVLGEAVVTENFVI